MGLFDKKEAGADEAATGADTQEAPRGESEQGPAATTPGAPEDGTADLTQASDGPADTQDAGPDEDEMAATTEPVEYTGDGGHIAFYTDTKYPVEACVACGHKHPKGQFENCDKCGVNIVECVGIKTAAGIVDPT